MLDSVALMIDIASVVAEQFSIRLGSYSLPELFRQDTVRLPRTDIPNLALIESAEWGRQQSAAARAGCSLFG